jgi:polysaccharide export outer membrane protein
VNRHPLAPSVPVRRHLLLALPLTGLLGACVQPGSGLAPIQETGRTDYRLGSGDTLRLLVFGDPRLNGEFRVSDDGKIALPLIGPQQAAGRTSRELEQAIAGQMQAQGVLRNAQVAVEVINFRPFFILGEVERPGQFPFQPGMTVLTAVAIGGGFTYRANRDFVSITRVVDGTAVEGRAQRQSFVQPGDVITVFERRF